MTKPKHSEPVTPLLIADAHMQAAYTRGEVTPLSPVITEFVQYLDHWWTLDHTDWIRIKDPNLITILNDQKAKMAPIEKLMRQHRA